tara:strand:- start:721 stop:852 length:132 start_codon:yes stop_codon:yes gene_type:complete
MNKGSLAKLETGGIIFLAIRIVEGGLHENKRKKSDYFIKEEIK